MIYPFSTLIVKPIKSLSKVNSIYPPRFSIASSNYYLFFLFVPLKKRLLKSLADPDDSKVSNLEPALKNKETVFSLDVYFSVNTEALLFKVV